MPVERLADRADAPVHHVRRRHHVGSGLGVTERLAHEGGDGLVVHHVSGRIDESILAVAGVRVERDVGDHAQIGKTRLERLHRARDEAIRIPGLGAVRGLPVAADHREERERRNRKFGAPFGIPQQEVDGLA